MPVHNSEIVEIFETIANLLEIKGANQFRIRAYRNAARTVSNLPESLQEKVLNAGNLTELPGIGEDLAGKIEEIVKKGDVKLLKELKEELPVSLLDIFEVEGLGPKKIKKLYEELNITDLDELEEAVESGEILGLEGFGEKTAEKILQNLARVKSRADRFLLSEIEQYAGPLIVALEAVSDLKKIEVAGSFRRRRESVGDLDILVGAANSEDIMDCLVNYEDVQEVIAHGDTKTSVVLRCGLQVDLRVVEEKSWGAALIYFTGSKEHNVALRSRGVKKELKVNEYGVYRAEKFLCGHTEKEVYECLDCEYIEPELRENRGELEAAESGDLPDLVSLPDIKGDLQSHTPGSDGQNSLSEMAETAQERGYEYLAITDHSDYLAITGGLDGEGLKKQAARIDELNKDLKDFKLLKSVEVDILPGGSLSLDDEVLKGLDIVSCAVHNNFNLSEEKQTRRVIEALKNPYVDIFVHPTGRKIGMRDPYAIDLEAVMQTALQENSFLEINAAPVRLDLNDIYARRAREIGLKLTISTDAHNTRNLDYMRYGVGQARRGWLEPDDVLNTRSWSQLSGLLTRNN